MPSVRFGANIEGGGVSINKSILRTSDSCPAYEVSLPVGYAGTLTTRTDDNTGTATLAGGHGITTGMIVDIHWAGGVQYGVTVGTVSVNSVPFDLGVGDNLPIATTAIVMTQQVSIATPIDGDALLFLALCLETTEGTSGKAHVDMQDVGPATIEELDLVGDTPRVFDITGGATNVFTGNPIILTKATNGSSTAAATLKIITATDATA